MKIKALYNTPVQLEEGDLIAKINGWLFIKQGDHIYKANKPLDMLDLNSDVHVNTVATIPYQHKFFSEVEWIKYEP